MRSMATRAASPISRWVHSRGRLPTRHRPSHHSSPSAADRHRGSAVSDAAMPALRVVSAAELRASVTFEDLIEPVARAFRESSSGQAHNGLIVMFPAERPELGDVYVK